MGYRVARLSTAVALDRAELFAPASGITAVHVLQIPAGVGCDLAIGDRGSFPAFAGFAASWCGAEPGAIVARVSAPTPGEIVVLGWTDSGSSTGPS